MKTDKNKVSLWERYLTKEIGIEFKACLYFFAILFYYCTYRVCIGNFHADIIHMAEMIFSTYVMGYIQVFLLWNFDEADAIGLKEGAAISFCTLVYFLLAFLLGWFDKSLFVTIGFAFYIVFMYVCVFLVYRARRRIDDKMLNDELSLFKTRNKE